MAKRKTYDHIKPGYVFVSKANYSDVGIKEPFVRLDIGDLCIVIDRKLKNPGYIVDEYSKYVFTIQNLDRKLTFTVDHSFPAHIPVNSKLAATLYC